MAFDISSRKIKRVQSPQWLKCDKHLFLHFYKHLYFHSENARNVFRTYSFTYVQIINTFVAILREKFEVDERWVLSRYLAQHITSLFQFVVVETIAKTLGQGLAVSIAQIDR